MQGGRENGSCGTVPWLRPRPLRQASSRTYGAPREHVHISIDVDVDIDIDIDVDINIDIYICLIITIHTNIIINISKHKNIHTEFLI